MRLGNPVQQQHRRAFTTPTAVDGPAGRGDVELLETVEHGAPAFPGRGCGGAAPFPLRT